VTSLPVGGNVDDDPHPTIAANNALETTVRMDRRLNAIDDDVVHVLDEKPEVSRLALPSRRELSSWCVRQSS